MKIEVDVKRLLQDGFEWFKANHVAPKVNFDALVRELCHAVYTNLDRFDKNEVYAPCDYLVRIAKQDADQLKRLKKFDLYQQKLERAVQEYIRSKGYQTTEETVRVRLEQDDRLDSGYVQVDPAFGHKDYSRCKTVYRPPVGQALAYVEWLNGPHKGDTIPMTRSKALIGRVADDNHPDIAIDDKRGWVGRRHAEIEQRGDQYFLTDLHSQNTTKLETPTGVQRLAPETPVALTDKSLILLADEYRLIFRLSDRLETHTRS